MDPAVVDRRAYFLIEPSHSGAMVFREAAERLMSTAAGRRVLWVTGTGSGRGTSLITLNLASALAVEGRVAIMDVRFDAPGLGPLLGVNGVATVERAYSERLRDLDAEVEAGLVGNRLVVMTTNGAVGAEVFSTDAFGSVVSDLAQTCDYLLLDGPPIRSLLERRELLNHTDGLIVVASPADLATGVFEKTLDTTDGHVILGCLINELES